MSDRQLKRKLTTILCADVKSYSHLMEVDEKSTFETLRRYRSAMASLIDHHDGRIVNTWGDAVIAEFPSVVEAVQCAIEIQQELAGKNEDLPHDRRMWFRIGINLGDVMIDGSDLYGEGVNIAARLQEVAEPGGIAISKTVYDQVRQKLAVQFMALGEQHVKNVEEPVITYRVALDPSYQPTAETSPNADPKKALPPSGNGDPEAVRKIEALVSQVQSVVEKIMASPGLAPAVAWWDRRSIWVRIALVIAAIVVFSIPVGPAIAVVGTYVVVRSVWRNIIRRPSDALHDGRDELDGGREVNSRGPSSSDATVEISSPDQPKS